MKRIAPGIVLTIFMLGAFLQALRIISNVVDWRELDYGEGVVLWQASQVFNLKSAFHPLTQYPHVVFHYTPIYHIVVKLLTAVLPDPLFAGRLVSLAAALWVLGLFAWTVLKSTRVYASAGIRWFAAVLTVACALIIPAMQWVPLARVDMLGLAFQFTALSVLSVKPFRLRNQIVAFGLLLLGLYTKQSLLAIPAASVLLVALIRPFRAMGLFLSLAGAGVSIFLILNRITHGGVLNHWLVYNLNPFHLRHLLPEELDSSTNIAAIVATGLGAFWLSWPRVTFRCWRAWRKSISARLNGNSLRRTGLGFGFVAVFGFFNSWGIAKEGPTLTTASIGSWLCAL